MSTTEHAQQARRHRLEFREATPDDVPAIAELRYHAFPGIPATQDELVRLTREAPLFHAREVLLGIDEGRIVCCARGIDFTAWVGGDRYRMLGVASVAVAPDARRRGHARAVVTELMRRGRAQGFSLSALYPFRHDFYASLGYAHVVERRQYAVNPADLPLYPERLGVRTGRPADAKAIAACYARVAERSTLMIERSPVYWRERTFERGRRHTAVYSEEGAVRGYLVFEYDREGRLPRLIVREAVYEDESALRGLLGHLAALRDQFEEVEITLPESARLDVRLRNPRDRGEWGGTISSFLGARIRLGGMARVLDVAAALRTRARYHDATGALRLSVLDEQIEENSWPLDLTFTDGRLEVTEAKEPGNAMASVAVPVSAWSQIALGFLSADEARSLGLLEGSDEAVALLDRAFRLPAPLLLDEF